MRQIIVYHLICPRFDRRVEFAIFVVMCDGTDSHGQILDDLETEELEKEQTILGHYWKRYEILK